MADLSKKEIEDLLELAQDIKSRPHAYSTAMDKKTLLMFFEKPSLRTRVSFETGMTQLGGHAIYYAADAELQGKKETLSDTAIVSSRYANVIMARVKTHKQIAELVQHSTVPVINGLCDAAHP